MCTAYNLASIIEFRKNILYNFYNSGLYFCWLNNVLFNFIGRNKININKNLLSFIIYN